MSKQTIDAAGEHEVPSNDPGNQASQYFFQTEQLLARIEDSENHYQVLGLGRSASADEVKAAYQEATLFLRVALSRSDTFLPETLPIRINDALHKITTAHLVLSNYGKRVHYDNSLTRPRPSPLPISIVFRGAPPPEASQPPSEPAPAPIEEQVTAPSHPSANTTSEIEPALSGDVENRRKHSRFKLAIPAQVIGYDKEKSKWQEIARTIDVSKSGAALRLRNRPHLGSVLYLTLPLPAKLRSHSVADATYNSYGLVRRVGLPEDGFSVVGVEFIGERMPTGYLHKPWAVFKSPRWRGSERRRGQRKDTSEPVSLDYFDEKKCLLGSGKGVIENISRTGARVVSANAPQAFDLIRLNCPTRRFTSEAVVRNRYLGRDGKERLCLWFVTSLVEDLGVWNEAPCQQEQT